MQIPGIIYVEIGTPEEIEHLGYIGVVFFLVNGDVEGGGARCWARWGARYDTFQVWAEATNFSPKSVMIQVS